MKDEARFDGNPPRKRQENTHVEKGKRTGRGSPRRHGNHLGELRNDKCHEPVGEARKGEVRGRGALS